MTPGARIAAAIDILDDIISGTAAEKALTSWARRSRFAGSKDRAAVRDHVFDALRNLRLFAALGGGMTGRGVMIGALHHDGRDLDLLFTGQGHTPSICTDTERSAGATSEKDAWNLPDPLIALFQDELGDAAFGQAQELTTRAPTTIRVNLEQTTRDAVRSELADAGFELQTNPLSDTALTCASPARGLTQTPAYLEGRFDMQDAGSQALINDLNISPSARVLDYCAGGGGKALALAARFSCAVEAHDANAARMKDLPGRAKRAQARIRVLKPNFLFDHSAYDALLLDVPCSGSGSWRRAPDVKWRFSQDDLNAVMATQREILDQTHAYVAPNGTLIYATCSVFASENQKQVDAFTQRYPEWHCAHAQSWPISEHGDGFFVAQLKRD